MKLPRCEKCRHRFSHNDLYKVTWKGNHIIQCNYCNTDHKAEIPGTAWLFIPGLFVFVPYFTKYSGLPFEAAFIISISAISLVIPFIVEVFEITDLKGGVK